MWHFIRRIFLISFLEDREFRDTVRQWVEYAEKEIAVHPASSADAIIDAQKEKIAKQGALLRGCLADYRGMHAMHASAYADRRFEELNHALEELDKT